MAFTLPLKNLLNSIPESRDTVFMRGFSTRQHIDEIRKFFQTGGARNTVEFFKDDGQQSLFIALRFDSKDIAKDIIDRYNNTDILGDRVRMQFYKDVRRARCGQLKKLNDVRDTSTRYRREDRMRSGDGDTHRKKGRIKSNASVTDSSESELSDIPAEAIDRDIAQSTSILLESGTTEFHQTISSENESIGDESHQSTVIRSSKPNEGDHHAIPLRTKAKANVLKPRLRKRSFGASKERSSVKAESHRHRLGSASSAFLESQHSEVDEAMVRYLSSQESAGKLDEIDTLVASYAPNLRRLSTKKRMLADLEIRRILFEAEFGSENVGPASGSGRTEVTSVEIKENSCN